MLSFLFGTKKDSKTVPQATKVDILPTLQMLTKEEEQCEKRISYLELQVKQQVNRAIEYNTAGKIDLAKYAIKRKLELEKQIQTNFAMLSRLTEQKSALESSDFNHNVFNAIKTASNVMKIQQQTLDVEKIIDINEELVELSEQQKEMNDVICQPLPGSISNDKLEEELNVLIMTTVPKTIEPTPPTIATAAAPLPDLPTVPSTEVNIEKELRKLELSLS